MLCIQIYDERTITLTKPLVETPVLQTYTSSTPVVSENIDSVLYILPLINRFRNAVCETSSLLKWMPVADKVRDPRIKDKYGHAMPVSWLACCGNMAQAEVNYAGQEQRINRQGTIIESINVSLLDRSTLMPSLPES